MSITVLPCLPSRLPHGEMETNKWYGMYYSNKDGASDDEAIAVRK